MKLLLNKSKHSGAQMVEYLILVGLIFMSVALAIELFGDEINAVFDDLTSQLSTLGEQVDLVADPSADVAA